jgi:purine-binding chemotaxis protein CheW
LNFRLQDLFSLPLGAVDEIAHCADNLLCPPGYPAFVKGVLKMRGEVITVIDLRAFYGMPKLAEPTETKVLIIRGARGRYGLLVDTVDSICTVEDAGKIPIPSLLQSDTARVIESDMAEVAEMKDASGVARTYMILDLPRLMARIEAPAA